MTQPPNPGQPFYQQQPSAPSAPAPGQPYPPQQQFQGAPGAPAAPGAPGQPFPQAPAGDSFMGNLFDTAKPFAEKFGKVFFYIAAIALVANWLYSAYNAGDIAGNYDIETQSRRPHRWPRHPAGGRELQLRQVPAEPALRRPLGRR